MRRQEAIRSVAAALRAEDVVICGLGTSARTWRETQAPNLTYYISDPMGVSLGMTLGFALARPTLTVTAIVGDGDLLMQVGVLATVMRARPDNLRLVLMSNGKYETGGGLALTAAGATDFASVATGLHSAWAGRLFHAASAADLDELVAAWAASPGPALLVLDVDEEPSPYTPEGVWSQAEQRAFFQAELKARLEADAQPWLGPTELPSS